MCNQHRTRMHTFLVLLKKKKKKKKRPFWPCDNYYSRIFLLLSDWSVAAALPYNKRLQQTHNQGKQGARENIHASERSNSLTEHTSKMPRRALRCLVDINVHAVRIHFGRDFKLRSDIVSTNKCVNSPLNTRGHTCSECSPICNALLACQQWPVAVSEWLFHTHHKPYCTVVRRPMSVYDTTADCIQ